MKKFRPVLIFIAVIVAVNLLSIGGKLLVAGIRSAFRHDHEWTSATCEEPRICKDCGEVYGEALGHDWTQRLCEQPKQCTRCGIVAEEALGHDWKDATCAAPMTCERCGLTEGEPKEHQMTAGTETSPALCTNCGYMIPLEFPASGQIFIGQKLTWGCTLTVKCTGSQSCYVKMKDADHNDVLSFFVRAGEQAKVYVPSGHYYVYFAHGVDWYGESFLFGEATTYSMDDELTDYVSYSWSYDLVPSVNGNFSDTPIDADQF